MEKLTSLRGSVVYDLQYVLARCEFIPFSGCWVYYEGKIVDGYGMIGNTRVHRLVYELITGEDIAYADLHHKCNVKSCCNPTHITKLSTNEHSTLHAPATEWCVKGHPFVKRATTGGCKTCHDLYRKNYRAIKRTQGVSWKHM